MLNTFEAPAIDAPTREFVITQRGEQLWGRHVFPETLHYTNGNERKFPFFTRRWVRYTEAFPEPWRMQATTDRRPEADFLTVISAPRASSKAAHEDCCACKTRRRPR